MFKAEQLPCFIFFSTSQGINPAAETVVTSAAETKSGSTTEQTGTTSTEQSNTDVNEELEAKLAPFGFTTEQRAVAEKYAETGDANIIPDSYGKETVDKIIQGVKAIKEFMSENGIDSQQGEGYNQRNGSEQIYTQRTEIPNDVLKTKPLNSPNVDNWLEKGGRITIRNGEWTYTDSQGNSITYKNGYPDFKGSGYVKQEVDIGPFTNRSSDFRIADKMAPNGPKSNTSTWHHNEDGRTLQEVNRDIHKRFTHRGGISEMK